MSETVDTTTGEVIAEEPTEALVAFGQDEIGVERATAIAKRLDSIIREKRLSVRIGSGEHLRVEAWCACGAMVGVTPRTEWTRAERNPEGAIEGFTARVEVVRIATGEVIGAAEASCWVDEKSGNRQRWMDGGVPNRHAMQSMAQTRATSKALGQILRWIPVMAGYSGTPAEEMPQEERKAPRRQRPAAQPEPEPKRQTPHEVPIGFGIWGERSWGWLAQGSPGGKRQEWAQAELDAMQQRGDEDSTTRWLAWALRQISNRADAETAHGNEGE